MSSIRRIVLTVYVWSPVGGTEQNITSLACALKRAGYDVVVLAWAYVADEPTSYEATLRAAGVRFISTNTFLGRLAFRWQFKVEVIDGALRRLSWLYAPLVLAVSLGSRRGWQPATRSVQSRLRAIALKCLQGFTADRYMRAQLNWLHWRRPVSVLNQHLSGAATAMQWARRQRVPVVYTEACLPDENNLGLWASIQPELPRVAAVVAASPAVGQALVAELGVAANRITVIPNIIEFAGAHSLRTSASSHGDVPTILFVGRLDPMKGVDVLLEAAALLKQSVPGWHLSIVGQGQLAGALQQQVERLGLSSQVAFVGNVDHADLPAHFENAWVLAAPSRYLEGFGMAVAEALSFGLPVVASDLPAFRTLIEPGQNGLLVPPENPEALVKALARLLQDPAERQRMRQAALAAANSHPFHPDVVARQTLEVYEGVLRQAETIAP